MASIALRVLLGLVVLAGAAWLVTELFSPPEAPAERRRWVSSRQCRECHPEVYAEWDGSWHSKSFVDPDVRDLSKEFTNTDCIDCHAPRPVFETGVGKRVLPRSDRRAEGVDCIACHLLPSGDVAGTIDDPRAACRPVAKLELQRVDYCGVCHNQHKTVDQWRDTPYAEQGIGCLECHMPFRDGDPNRGRDHTMAAAHDLDLIRGAIVLEARREGERVVVEVENVGAGHSYPTDERSRASDLWWRPVPSAEEEAEAPWFHLHRIRDPYRYETDLPRNLLEHGERRRLDLEDPRAAGAVEVLLVYKLTPYYRDPATGEAVAIEEVTDPLTDSLEVHRVRVD